MNLKILVILIVGISALSVGFLSNEVPLDIQGLDLIIMPQDDGSLTGATMFSSVECSCGTDPLGPFGACNTTPGDPDSLGDNGNELCT